MQNALKKTLMLAVLFTGYTALAGGATADPTPSSGYDRGHGNQDQYRYDQRRTHKKIQRRHYRAQRQDYRDQRRHYREQQRQYRRDQRRHQREYRRHARQYYNDHTRYYYDACGH